MKQLILLTCALMASVTLVAQDIIVTKDAKKIDAKILEVSKTEIKYKEVDNLEGPTFVLETEEISSILYSNGKVEVYNQYSEEDSLKSAKEETANNGKSLNYYSPVPANENIQYVARNGNTYYYGGNRMKGASYENFLLNNCKEAYDQYKSGHNVAIAGWVLFGVGLGMDVCLSWWVPYAWVPALACEIACIPTLSVGYVRMHRSADTYNVSCAKRNTAYWSINASQNGLGIALNF